MDDGEKDAAELIVASREQPLESVDQPLGLVAELLRRVVELRLDPIASTLNHHVELGVLKTVANPVRVLSAIGDEGGRRRLFGKLHLGRLERRRVAGLSGLQLHRQRGLGVASDGVHPRSHGAVRRSRQPIGCSHLRSSRKLMRPDHRAVDRDTLGRSGRVPAEFAPQLLQHVSVFLTPPAAVVGVPLSEARRQIALADAGPRPKEDRFEELTQCQFRRSSAWIEDLAKYRLQPEPLLIDDDAAYAVVGIGDGLHQRRPSLVRQPHPITPPSQYVTRIHQQALDYLQYGYWSHAIDEH